MFRIYINIECNHRTLSTDNGVEEQNVSSTDESDAELSDDSASSDDTASNIDRVDGDQSQESLVAVVSAISISVIHKCDCKTKCKTKRCPCKHASQAKCTTACHPDSMKCENK